MLIFNHQNKIKFLFLSFTSAVFIQGIYAGVDCEQRDYKSCTASSNCSAVYGPSTCGKDSLGNKFCTEDIVFKSCRSLSPKEYKKSEKIKAVKNQEKNFCLKTKGEWRKMTSEKFGNCHCQADLYFIAKIGCTSEILECSKTNGIFHKKGNLECDDLLRKTIPRYCRKKFTFNSKYNNADLCLCPNKTLGVVGRKAKKCSTN